MNIRKQQGQYILWFILGAACFFISQPLLRLQLLGLVQGSTDFQLFALLNPVLTTALIGLSAGIFEEGFRFLFKQFLLRPARCGLAQPLLFGLGHGLMEAGLLLLPAIFAGYSLSALWLGMVERALTIPVHIALTVLVWNGFQTGKRLIFLLAAIGVHGLIDTVLPLLQQYGLSAVQIELVYSVMVLLLVGAMAYSRKYYRGGNFNEKQTQPAQ